MPELLKLNRHPLHQAALRHLLQLRQEPLDNRLYSLQLMSWGLASQQVLVEDQFRDDLSDQVGNMLSWDQKQAHDFLLGEKDLKGESDLAKRLKSLPANKAAWELVQLLHNKLLVVQPAYRPGIEDRG